MPKRRGSMRWLAALGIGALLVVSALIAGQASAVGPYPALGACSVFPQPPASLSPRAPSLSTEAAWNQDISKAPRDPRSSAYIAYINAHGGDHLHPDFGSPRPYGFPYSVVDAGQRKLPIHYTAYGDESDPGPFPVPPRAPVEGGNRSDGDRHVLVVDRSGCRLYELYRAFYIAKPRPHWNADSGTEWDLRSAARRADGWTSADAAGLPIFPRPGPPRQPPRGLALGRRRRPADLPRPGPLRRGRRRSPRPRHPRHLRQHPRGLG